MNEPIPSVAQQLDELDKQYADRLDGELKEIRETYEHRDDTMQTAMFAYGSVLRDIAQRAGVSLYEEVTPTRVPRWGPKEDFPDDELVQLADTLSQRLEMAKDFETLITHVKADEILTAMWDDLCLMIKMREDV